MGKAAGAMVMVLLVGSGAMSLLSNVLGAHAEAAALTFIGLGLVATGQALGAARQLIAPKPREAQ